MFLIKAGTVILIDKPLKGPGIFDWAPWKAYTTKEDKIYSKEEVWDAVAVANERDDIPAWAMRNVKEHGKVVIQRAGKFAMAKASDVVYLD